MNEHRFPWLAAGWALLLALCLPWPGVAAAGDTVADGVLGQRSFNAFAPFLVDGLFTSVSDLAVDRSVTPNRAYLADIEMNRVLGWSDVARLRAGAPADLVLGEPSLFDGTYMPYLRSCPAPSATTFCRPSRLAVDPAGNLYVVDSLNHRVLEFDAPFTHDRTADRVFGQPGFTSRHLPPQPSYQLDVSGRLDVAVDGAGHLWMVATSGSRAIWEFDAPLSPDPPAGQPRRPDRIIASASVDDCFGRHPADRICGPYELAFSPQGDLYVRDAAIWQGPNFLWVFRQPLTTDLAPDFSISSEYGTGLAFDPAGNLYTTIGSRLQRFAAPVGPAMQPETLFQLPGDDSSSSIEGRVASDADGNLLIAHYQATYIQSTGSVFTFAPPYASPPAALLRDLRATTGGLTTPTLVAVDRSAQPNHLYALDGANRVVGWRDAAGFADGAPPDLVIRGARPDLACGVVDARHFCAGDTSIVGGLAVDSHGNLWLSDTYNNRVLELDRPFESDAVAGRVLGQGGSFTTARCNQGGIGAASLCNPGALAFDGADHLYVADIANNRVLRFRDPLHDATAEAVFGQPDFRHSACNHRRRHPLADSLCFGYEQGDINVHFYGASGLALDPRGTLYIADSQNARVLAFRDPLHSTLPDAVLGQDGHFDTALWGTGTRRFNGSASQSLFGPSGLAVGPKGDLYVADSPNGRVLVFPDPLHHDTAKRLFGQADFDTFGITGLGAPPPTTARLFLPLGLAFDAAGNLFVADSGYNRILRFDRP